ncbi:MAG: hypothetical protein AAF483_11155 [Planctomycetota bacterium]
MGLTNGAAAAPAGSPGSGVGAYVGALGRQAAAGVSQVRVAKGGPAGGSAAPLAGYQLI